MVTKQLTYNVTPTGARVIEYIVVHDTGNKSVGANAQMHFNYFNGGDRGASADFFVDSAGAWKVNDYRKHYSWHCGDGHGMYGISNKNSIGVEICVNADGDYDKAYNNAIELVRKLKEELPKAKVVRHYDASHKNCPASMSANNWGRWNTFIERVNTMTHEEILKKVCASPDEWIKAITYAMKEAHHADSKTPIFKYLPELLKKLYYTNLK
jgi:N-acetylmuramoyl-L-alanine amidase